MLCECRLTRVVFFGRGRALLCVRGGRRPCARASVGARCSLPVAQVAQIFGGVNTLGIWQTGVRFCRVFDDRQRAVAAPSCNGRRVIKRAESAESDVLAVR